MVKRMQGWMSVAVMVVSSVAGAQSLAQRKAREHALENQSHDIQVAASSCGTEVKVAFDWDTFDGTFDATHSESTAASFCAMVFQSVYQICAESKDGKEAIAKTLKEVHCSYNKDVTPKAKFDMKGGVLYVTYSYRMNSMQADSKKFLMDHL
jgi:hypothetical protein